MKKKADIGLIGLAVMGQNLVMNMCDHGYTVAAYNRTAEKTDDLVNGPGKGMAIIPAYEIDKFVASLSKPRKIMLMVKAGDVVDKFIQTLVPHLEAGDVIIDGGNSHFPDTARRTKSLAEKGILYIGTGISGGEEGARNGPSIMPGGNPAAWPLVKNVLQDIAAKTDDGEPCCEWVGEDGAGHYVKMVHNGIEYGDMQLISEAYQLMKAGLGLSHEEMHRVFSEWNRGELDSYLIEITADILNFRDADGSPLVEKILDSAGQKGTGKWTGINALEMGMPVTLIAEAVFARCLSALYDERQLAAKTLAGPSAQFKGDKKAFVDDIRQALLASKIVSYAQGFMLIREAEKEYGWKINYGGVANMWRGGCIIRSVFLGDIRKAFDKKSDLYNLMLDIYFRGVLERCQNSWRRVVAESAYMGIPVPAFATSLAFYDGYRSAQLPANLIQAQRDYFGAHTYERTDRPRGQFFHTNWTGKGGEVAAGTYNA
ncbi:MAG TPA: decarboxylating NADP(+)-dependent phosphogluconate dehydrogenase [Spirochaetia bacterium]|nr:decarboxylating NADP(+)-dependent phosphogluconate dehydrogenase [Spirochaetia bacterium]